MRKGIILISTLIFSSILILLTVILAKIYYNGYIESLWFSQKREAFWLAEAGVAQAKVELVNNPNWYTDSTHYPKDDSKWLINQAIGQITKQGKGWIKIVHEERASCFYSVGNKGAGVVLIKVSYQSNPFKIVNWQEL